MSKNLNAFEGSVRITVLAGQTFRGVLHFQEQDYNASSELAAYAIREGIARKSDKE